MKKLITPRLAQAVLAISMTIAALAPAQAAIISTEWDPVFGPPLTGLGWKGSMRFDSESFKVLELNVSFYDAADPTRADISTGTRLFTADSVKDVEVKPVSFTSDGKVKTFQSNRTEWQLGLDTSRPSLTKEWLFSIQFEINADGRTIANLFAKNPESASADVYSSEEKAIVYCVPGDATFDNAACGLGARSGTVVGAVPEPGSFALVFAALMGAGWVARRRQRQGHTPAFA